MSWRERAYYRLFGADRELRRHLPLGTVLDIGCSDGRGSAIVQGAFGCDIHLPALQVAVSSGRRRSVVQADIRALPYVDGAFDTVVAFDVIEHFDTADGYALLHEMRRVARRQVALLTPSGFVPQPPNEKEPWQEHRSGYSAADLRALGFDVVGVGGLGLLRTDYGAFRGGAMGQLAAVVSSPFIRRRADASFHLFAHCDISPP